jgi:hypothetical protein
VINEFPCHLASHQKGIAAFGQLSSAPETGFILYAIYKYPVAPAIRPGDKAIKAHMYL